MTLGSPINVVLVYTECDLHGTSNLLGVIDGQGRWVFKTKLSNHMGWIREAVVPLFCSENRAVHFSAF